MSKDERKTNKTRSFKKLMVEHVEQTIAFIEATYESREEDAKTAYGVLTRNTLEWCVKLAPANDLKQQEFKRLLTTHILIVAGLAKAIFACTCTSAKYGHCHNAAQIRKSDQELVENQVMVVAFLVGVFGPSYRDTFNDLWTKHLHCTSVYINTLKETQSITDKAYLATTKICRKLGKELGEALDGLQAA